MRLARTCKISVPAKPFSLYHLCRLICAKSESHRTYPHLARRRCRSTTDHNSSPAKLSAVPQSHARTFFRDAQVNPPLGGKAGSCVSRDVYRVGGPRGDGSPPVAAVSSRSRRLRGVNVSAQGSQPIRNLLKIIDRGRRQTKGVRSRDHKYIPHLQQG